MKISSTLFWGILNQGCNIFIPFIITLISFKYFPPEISSIWVIFLSMTSLVVLFDFGLSPAIVRNVSYVIAGAQNLIKTGVEGLSIDKKISYPLLSRLISDVKKIYFYLSISAFFIIGVGGGYYFYYISLSEIKSSILCAWTIFSFGLILNLFYLYYTPVLMGLGAVKDAYKANVFGRVSWLVMSILLLVYNPSIILLSCCFVISILLNRLVSSFFYKNNIYIKKIDFKEKFENSTIPYIGHNAVKLGAVSFGSFLINRSTTLIVGLACPIIVAGQFVLTIQVFSALVAVSNILLTIKIPEISKAVAKHDKKIIYKLVRQVILFSSGVYFLGFFIFMFLMRHLIFMFDSNISFLPSLYLFILGLVYYLEMNHSVCATIITTKNKIPFVYPALISGFLIVVLSIVFSYNLGYGVMGLILVQGGVQLLYNNWKWPLVVYKEFIK